MILQEHPTASLLGGRTIESRSDAVTRRLDHQNSFTNGILPTKSNGDWRDESGSFHMAHWTNSELDAMGDANLMVLDTAQPDGPAPA